MSFDEAAATDSNEAFPEKTLQKIISSGLLSAAADKKYGGQNLGLKPGTNLILLTLLKNIGRGNLVMGRVLEGHINAQILIGLYGSKKQKKFFAEDAASGKLFGVWNTQAGDGTTLSFKHKKNKKSKIRKQKVLFLNGSKTFATGSGYVSRPLVTAAMPDGSWQMCIVPLDEIMSLSDSSWWHPMGMKASRSFKISFLNAPIHKLNILGKGGDYYSQPAFGGGAIRFAAVQLGGAEKLLDETKIYLKNLKRTDDPYQNKRIGEMAIAVESGNLWITAAAQMIDSNMRDSKKFTAESLVNYANMMRTAVEQICTLVISHCMACVGARGLNKPHHFDRMIRDLQTYLRQPAPDAVLSDVGSHFLKLEKTSGNFQT